MKLTRREYEIAELIALGLTPSEIAENLFIAKYTVDNHIKSIREKLNISSMLKIAPWYYSQRFHFSIAISKSKAQIIALVLLMLILPYELISREDIIRTPARTSISRSKKEDNGDIA